jgi:hypothetical protein
MAFWMFVFHLEDAKAQSRGAVRKNVRIDLCARYTTTLEAIVS